MKLKIFSLCLFFCFLSFTLKAQLVLSGGLTPQQLANTIAGPGVSVSNVTLTGATSMTAAFTAAGTNLGIPAGVLLATGDASFAVGPNSDPGAGINMGLAGNLYLDSIANDITFDACVLEFDFVPQSSAVSFKYVFGSEEYPEFVCSGFNDVFAFLISGPGIFGSLNMAIVPGTSTSVAINVVNGGLVGSNGFAGPHCILSNPSLYVDNSGGSTLELDGFTVRMTAQAIVQPCQTYHLRILIADVGDGAYDSGVFIEEGSLFSTPIAGPDQQFCSGDSVVLGSPGSSSFIYQWTPATGLSNPFAANPSVQLVNNSASPITYTYILNASTGTCVFSDSVNVTVNPAPSANFTVSPAQACEGDTVTVVFNGVASGPYLWNFGSATVLSGSGAGPYQLTYSASGQDSVKVITGATGCLGSMTKNILIKPTPIASFSIAPQACLGDTVAVQFTGTNTGSVICAWNFDNALVLSGNNIGPYSLSWMTPGVRTISLVTSEDGCVSVPASLSIAVHPDPVVFAGNNITTCPGDPVQLGEVSQAGNIYSWSPSTGLDDASRSNPSALLDNTGLVAQNYIYQLTVTSSVGCDAIDDVQVTVNPSVNVSFVAPPAQCMTNNSFDFSVQGNYPVGSVFNWDFTSAAFPPSSSSANERNVHFNVPGIHGITLNASYESCVMQPVSHTIEVFSEPDADFFSLTLRGCSPLDVSLASLVPDTSTNYFWILENGSTSSDSDPDFTLIAPGTYDVSLTATNSNGCSKTSSKLKYFTVFPNPVSSFISDPPISTIESPLINFANNSSQADFYHWDFGDSSFAQTVNATHLYPSTGIYQVMLIAYNYSGCIDTSYGSVEINEGLSFFVPNSFTPNGDGVNDFFQGYGINFTSYQMIIYDRWGEKVFESNEYSKPWDGRVKSVVQNEVFVYKIVVVDKFKELHKYIGSVAVVK